MAEAYLPRPGPAAASDQAGGRYSVVVIRLCQGLLLSDFVSRVAAVCSSVGITLYFKNMVGLIYLTDILILFNTLSYGWGALTEQAGSKYLEVITLPLLG